MDYGNLNEAIRLRTKASEMFRKAGNAERAERILLWLNTTVSKKQNNSKNKKNPKLTQKKIKEKQFQDKKLSNQKTIFKTQHTTRRNFC